jgi:hypothetical protein
VNHIATGRALCPGGELLPPHHRRQQVDGDGGEVDGDGGDGGDGDGDRWTWLRGHFPVPVGCRNRDFCPPKFVNGGGGAAELFLEICRLF